MKKSGFSLMEMMIVLLIVAIIAAASAPMLSKKLLRDAPGGSPWLYTLNGSITYNPNGSDSKTAMIGASKTPNSFDKSKLYIETTANEPQMALGESGGKNVLGIQAKSSSISISNKSIEDVIQSVMIGYDANTSRANSTAIGYSATTTAANSIAIGYKTKTTASNAVSIGDSTTTATATKSVALGANAEASGTSSVAIGDSPYATGNQTVAIGYDSNATAWAAVALGYKADATKAHATALGYCTRAQGLYSTAVGDFAIASSGNTTAIGYATTAKASNATALGYSAGATGTSSTAIGYGATAAYANSTAIGRKAKTTASNQIVIGTANDTVVVPGRLLFKGELGDENTTIKIPGKLEVAQETKLGTKSGPVWLRVAQFNGRRDQLLKVRHSDGSGRQNLRVSVSDRRLKNVGKAFTDGLDKIKQLKVYNYTLKNDPTKEPRVGVMAQDLQKIFPDAVFKGEDGFLMIRMEDMFYALVNAVKELDLKITNENAQLKKRVAELEKQNKLLEKRLTDLEKKVK